MLFPLSRAEVVLTSEQTQLPRVETGSAIPYIGKDRNNQYEITSTLPVVEDSGALVKLSKEMHGEIVKVHKLGKTKTRYDAS